MASLTFELTNNNLGGQALGTDYYSCLVFDAGVELSGVTGIIENATDGYQLIQITSIQQAESIGITSTLQPLVHLQLTGYFTMKSDGLVWVANIIASGGTFAEIPKIQKYLNGVVKQFGVFSSRTLSTALLANVQTQMAAIQVAKMPAVAVTGWNTSGETMTNLEDLSTLQNHWVSVMLGQNGSTLMETLGFSIPEVGAVLGALSDAKVSESCAWFDAYQFDFIDEPAIGDGTLLKNLDQTYINTNFSNKNFQVWQTEVGSSSIFLNQSFTATSRTDDYKSLELGRTILKAERQLNAVYVYQLNSPIKLDTDGNIDTARVSYLENIGNGAMAAMKSAGEISEYKIYIDNTQDIISDNTLHINCAIIPYATANQIVITLGYTTSIS